MMTHDYNTRGKKHGNVLNDDDPLTNTKLEENIINHKNASVSSLRDEFLNLKAIVIKRLQDEKKYMFFLHFMPCQFWTLLNKTSNTNQIQMLKYVLKNRCYESF